MPKKELYEMFATFPYKKKNRRVLKNFTNSKSIYEGKGDLPSGLAATPLSFDSEFCFSACLLSSSHHKPVNLSINCRVFQYF